MKSVFMLSVVIFYGFLMGRSQQIEKFAALDTISMGARWLDSVDVANNEQHGFQVAAAHNTGATGSNGWYATFVNKAQSLGKEAWNTELHKWVGADSMRQEIMTSDIFSG